MAFHKRALSTRLDMPLDRVDMID